MKKKWEKGDLFRTQQTINKTNVWNLIHIIKCVNNASAMTNMIYFVKKSKFVSMKMSLKGKSTTAISSALAFTKFQYISTFNLGIMHYTKYCKGIINSPKKAQVK